MSFSSQESFFVTLCWYKHVSLFSYSAVLVLDLSLLQPLTYLLDEHPLIIATSVQISILPHNKE